MKRTDLHKLDTEEEFTEYYKLELSQAIERVNALENIRLQLGIFFGTANFTVIGIAVYVQKTVVCPNNMYQNLC